MESQLQITDSDKEVLRRLAGQVAEIAQRPENLRRKELWYQLDEGTGGRPMILAEYEGVRDNVAPLPDSILQCADSWARQIERNLRARIYQYEELKDDHVVEPCWNVSWDVQTSDYGVPITEHESENADRLGAKRWDPPIQDVDQDYDKLRPRSYTVDRERTLARKDFLDQIFGDILNVRIRGVFWWTMGLTYTLFRLLGLQNMMLFMYDQPEGIHRLMTFLRDDHLAFANWLEREQLLSPNNENEYLGSGSLGYCRDLPQSDWTPGQPIRKRDLWVLLESQETVGVGPEQYEEFIFPYESAIAKVFGKCYYGCCEPIHTRWNVVKNMPNLSRVSVSPWADESILARELGRAYVYSRKPSPTLISTQQYDENAIREDLRNTLRVARDCRVEIIMKDVHTLNDQPGRLSRWVEIAREVSQKMGL